MTDINTANANLQGVTIVTRLELTSEITQGRSRMVLELVDDERVPSRRVVVKAVGVDALTLKRFSGFTQLMCLRVKDVRELQHDRIGYVIEDLEDCVLSLRCERFEVRLDPLQERDAEARVRSQE